MARIALIAVAWLSLAVSSSRPLDSFTQGDSHAILAATLLDESYNLSSNLDEIDRIRYLGDLVINSPSIAPERVEEWSRELIRLSRTSKNEKLSGWDRIANQKIAVVALSKTNPVAAMQLFSEIGPPARTPENRLPEDVRAFGARVLFLNYFRALGPESLPKIQHEARSLAETKGAYPFHAMSLIIGEMGGTGTNGSGQANEIFADALSYYRCDSEVENQDSEFLTLLQNTKAVVSKTLFIKAVHEFATHLTDPRCDNKPKIDQFVAIIQTSKGTLRLTDERKTLLFRAFSLINEADPAFAKELQTMNPELANADATINQVAGSYVSANLPQEEQTRRQKTGLQRSLLRGIRNMRESNPQAALQMAEALEDPDSRIVAISSVLPPLAQRDLQQTKQLYARELNEFDSLKGSRQRAEATLWMAETAYHTEDFDNFQYLATKTFTDGIQQFEASYVSNNDSAEIAVDDRPGYRELTELVQFAVAHDINWPLDEIRQLTNMRLKVHLLMYAAKGLAHRRT